MIVFVCCTFYQTLRESPLIRQAFSSGLSSTKKKRDYLIYNSQKEEETIGGVRGNE